MTQHYEFNVKYAALQLEIKILGDGEGFSLTEFCEKTNEYVFVAEMWDKRPYSLSLLDIYDIIEARRLTKEKQ